MFVVISNYGNTDGDMGSMLVGVYDELPAAQEAMKDDYEGFIEESGWERGDHELKERFASAMDGDWCDHTGYSVWLIFDSDEIGNTAVNY